MVTSKTQSESPKTPKAYSLLFSSSTSEDEGLGEAWSVSRTMEVSQNAAELKSKGSRCKELWTAGLV